MIEALLVTDPGLLATLQDLGREGHRGVGVPTGGAFDVGSMALANALVGNPAGAAVLELTMRGGTYRAELDLAIALAGAPMTARLLAPGIAETKTLRIPSSFALKAGSTLELGTCSAGVRTYLAVAGGWQAASVMSSQSSERPIAAGERLSVLGTSQTPARWVPGEVAGDAARPFRVIDGPDVAWSDPAWCGREYRVGPRSNRMGLRLEGQEIRAADHEADRLSAPVAPGAVQLAGGQLLVLGVACGTMGGYPHVAHVITADLGRLGQLRPGETVRFRRISIAEARRFAEVERGEQERRLRVVRAMAADRG